MNKNTTIGERAAAKQIRSEMDAAQERKRELNATLARRHLPPGGGTTFSASVEAQPGHKRPVINPLPK
jgi:hypothetical protein